MQIEFRGKIVETDPIDILNGKRIRTEVDTADLVPDTVRFLRYVANYLQTTGERIRNDETFAYGYWLTHFTELEDQVEINEYSIDGSTIVPGVTRAVTYWRMQNQLCAKYSAIFTPPLGSSLVVVSNSILSNALSVQGVRYPSPSHMSGWWLTDDEFDGDVGTLSQTHAYHLAAARPELVHLLALPYGYRFDLRSHEDVWFDEDVSREPA